MCFGVLSSTHSPLSVPPLLVKEKELFFVPLRLDESGKQSPSRFWRTMSCVVYRKVLFDVHRFLWRIRGLRLYSVCLLKRNINVNLTWNCKKSCEYPSISRHHLKVFGNKYEYCYMINILYITKQLLWASESYQNSKWSFLFVSFFNLWLIFLCLFFSSFRPMLFICSVSLRISHQTDCCQYLLVLLLKNISCNLIPEKML